ncbi:MAG: LysM peptidoglycan-binding domain-containing protein [Pseudomonadales bacterium]
MLKTNSLKWNVLGLIGALLLSFTATAEDVQLAPNHPSSYTVKKGDTLWSISGVFLQQPWEWPKIWHVNPEICNPHLIYPGDTVNLNIVDGKPQLDVTRANPCGGTVKMSPSTDNSLKPRIRVEQLESPIPAIPLDIISPFLTGSRVVSPGTLEAAPYVLAGAERHVITGAGDSINARGEFEAKVPTYGVYRKGKTYADETTGEVLGVAAIDIGTAKITQIEGDIAKLSVLRSTRELLGQDRLLPSEERAVDAIFYPTPPKSDIVGKIIDVDGGVSEYGAMNVVLIDKGKRDGLEAGNVLAIFAQGETMKDPVTGETVKLINERAGLLMVFNVFDKTSYALVLETNRPLTLGAEVKNP